MKIRDIVNREVVNLENCESEPIHIPGSIQPHGFLIAVKKDDYTIDFCSENVVDFTGLTYQQLLGKKFETVFGNDNEAALKDYLGGLSRGSSVFDIRFNDNSLRALAHFSNGHIIVEAEPQLDDVHEAYAFYRQSREFLAYMEETHTLKQLCALVAQGVRTITGYDRVMIYRFDKEYNGEVFAESCREDLEPFLGLHYPHTDIPVQARELYMKNLMRLIVDVNYKPVPIYTIDDTEGKNLDLGVSVLRSVSPIHVQYLHNMGVGGTLTISLLHNRKLWGLIACHHYSAKNLSYETRLAAQLQGHFITSQIQVRQSNEEYECTKRSNEALNKLLDIPLDSTWESLQLLVRQKSLQDLCDAPGVSIVARQRIFSHGHTPAEKDVLRIAKFFAGKANHLSIQSTELGKQYPELADIGESFPGIYFVSLNSDTESCIIWFRPETITEVKWAGDPNKAIVKDVKGLHPRKSFETWKQFVKGTSKDWLSCEVNAGLNYGHILQKHVNSIVLRVEELKQMQLMHTLQETNAELENINWIGTHDLQEPLRKIQMFSSQLMMTEKDDLTAKSIDKINRMNKSAEKMQTLIQDILRYMRLKNTDSQFVEINLNELINSITENMREMMEDVHFNISVDKLPPVKGEVFLLKQLFSNLFFNSVKFTKKDEPVSISITSTIEEKELYDGVQQFTVISFADNGIGFDPKYNESIFNVFTRLHSADKYPGSGIGLALCRRIMKTHGGNIYGFGQPDKGATFKLYFPKDRAPQPIVED